MKTVSILGVTGSIGASSLKVIDNNIYELNLLSFSTHSNIEKLLKLIDKYNPEYAVVTESEIMYKYFGEYEHQYKNTKIYSGNEGLLRICSDKRNDIILNAVSGKAGLMPSYYVLDNGINLALANKESIVCAGPILKELSLKNNCSIIPVDSEHSAIFHLIENKHSNFIDKIYLTASGGPFYKLDKSEWDKITVKEALNHPTWKMGNKISIDSATMANKGLEVIETERLFNMDYNRIKVIIHPQSLIHSMLETIDGEIYAQLGPNDMAIPILNAFFYPDMRHNRFNRFDFSRSLNLEIHPIDLNKFRMLDFAFYCGRKSGLYPSFFNSVNEISVNLFLQEKIKFINIEHIMEKSLETFESDNSIDNYIKEEISLENIKIIDKLAEEYVGKILKHI